MIFITFFEKMAKKMSDCVGNALISFLLILSTLCTYADVYISEFMADNNETLMTAEGESADWIELHNDGPVAADISGWYLTDEVATPAKWAFPINTVLAEDGYLIVFVDGSDISITNNELHANFKLSDNGEYLALVQSNGTSIAYAFSPDYPKQYEDVAYGLVQLESTVINETTPARYKVPNAVGTAPWHSAVGGLGFTESIASFTVHYYELNTSVSSVDQAETMIADPSCWKTTSTFPLIEQYSVVNLHGSAGSGNFGGDDPFPNQTIGVDINDFVVTAETAIYIPTAGTFSFAVGSDDGFRLNITGQGQSFGSEYTGTRGFGTTVGAFNFPAAGYYDLRLLFFERGGGATVELSCAAGSFGEFDGSAFKLVGAPDAPVSMAANIGALINTDVREEMININSRLDAEWTFELPPTIQPDDIFILNLNYMDGCSVAVNGTPINSCNVPSPLSWNSTATSTRTLEEGTEAVAISIPYSALSIGNNTLSITALNNSSSDSDFLVYPVLSHTSSGRQGRYFPEPTPGEANGEYYNGPTPKVTITEPRGYKTSPFTTELLCIDSPGSIIRYTTDGSIPDLSSPVYSVPLAISSTTLFRAAVVDPESYRQRTASTSWLFIEDVLTQNSATPPGWPGSYEVNNHKMEYGLRADIVSGDPARIRQGMTNDIPSLSIVTDLKNLFDPQSGIYVNPTNEGQEWERPVSVELIDTARGEESEFQIDAGLRIRGAASRNSRNPKHSFRLFFRSQYGEGKLKFKLFDDEGTDEYDNVDLRTAQNYSWSYSNDGRNTFAREVFSRDTQRDMGAHYTRSRYYHLYLNGQYWGLYQTQERGNANFADSYLPGKDEDYDCVKVSQPGYVLATTDGNFDAYFDLHNYTINQGFSGIYSNNYWTIRGLDPDGTINTNKLFYLDQDNLINYELSCYITGDPDAPIILGGGKPNNLYALYNRNDPAGFTWLRHDAEHSMGAHSSYGVNTDITMRGSTLTAQYHFNPATLHIKLCDHPEYRMRFADLTYKHMFNGGVLTPEKCLLRFQSRTTQIDNAIVGESARWGRGKTRTGNWIPACDTVINTYIPFRTDIVIGQLKANGWYPSIEPPMLSTNSTSVPEGYSLSIASEATFYYTIDGADPRMIGGGIYSNAVAIVLPPGSGSSTANLIAKGSTWSYYDAGVEPLPIGSFSWKDPAYSGVWAQGPGILGFAGSTPQNTVATTTTRYVNGVSGTQVTTTYFRCFFYLNTTNGLASLTVELLRDDGAVIYINGAEVTRHNMPAGAITYSIWAAGVTGSDNQTSYHQIEVTDISALKSGENVIAVEVHQINSTSSDMYMDMALTAKFSGLPAATTLSIEEPTTVMARSFDGSEWSALAEASFEIAIPVQDYKNLKITELMYAPTSPADPGSPLDNDDFAWLEIRNTGLTTIDLNGISFTDGITHTFSPCNLLPGARLVVSKNPDALHQRHSTNSMTVTSWTSGNLSRSGEIIQLSSPASSNILTFAYSSLWYPETYNTDNSIVVVDTSAPEAAWSTFANWHPARAVNGTPGNPDAPVFNALVMGPGDFMTVNTVGLEGTIELWYSEDMDNWSPCNANVWSRNGDELAIDLKSTLLPNNTKGFFQMRISD